MSRRIILLLGLILIAVTFIIRGDNIFGSLKQDSPDPDVAAVVKSAWDVCRKDYSCLKEKIQQLLSTTSLTQLMTSTDQLYGPLCHDQAHAIGQIAGETENDTARTLQSCTPQCGYGCFHGVVLGAVKVQGDQILQNLPSLCQQYSDSSFPGQGLTACRHGLGHGLAELSGYSLSKATSYCDRLEDRRSQDECITGVLMEIIESSIADPKNPRILIPENVTDFCQDLSGSYRETCLINIGSYEYKRSGDLKKSFSLCKTLPTNLQDNCAGDMGTDIYFQERDAGKIWQACAESDDDQKFLCLKGAVFSSLVEDPKGTLGKEICIKSPEIWQTNCLKYLEQSLSEINKNND